MRSKLHPGTVALTFTLLFGMLGAGVCPAATTTLIAKQSTWKYLDGNINPGNGWEGVSFNDSSWASGPGPLGGGDAHIRTTVEFGTSTARYPTILFRKYFTVSSARAFQGLTLNLMRDDGALVFINGIQVVADGASSPFSFGAWSTQTVGGTDETTYFTHQISASSLVDGVNVIAVALKQCNTTSSDLGFDLELLGTADISVALDSPTAGAGEVPIPAVLTATATHPAGANTDVRFYGRPSPTASTEPNFSIIVLPDTQNYTAGLNGGTPAMFMKQTEWIRANRSALSIAYVAHMGDISNDGDMYETEWMNASDALYPLELDGIPYGAAVGNHDQMVPTGDTSPTTYYNQYFGVSHFTGKAGYGGSYGVNNNNHYDTFSAGGMDFIVIYFEYSLSQNTAVLAWADALLKANPTKRAILVTHYFLNLDNTWGTQGETIYNYLKGNPNLFLLLCGHNHGEARRTDVYNGTTVNTILSDYQSETGGGNGYLRILEFSPANNEIRVSTYSPYLNQYRAASTPFTLNYNMGQAAAFTQIQLNSGVPSGSQTTATWAGLQQFGDYEWYVEASDGTVTQRSETRRFTTGTVPSTPPGAPTGLAAIAKSSSAIELTWNDISANETGFEIEVKLSGESAFTSAGTLPANTTTAVVSSLQPQTEYSFQVRAVNGAGKSAPSNVASASTLPANHVPVAQGQTATVPEDTALPLTLIGTDAGGQSLTYLIVTQPLHGTLSTVSEGQVTYTPNRDYYGDDSFTFRAFDGQDYSQPATVEITVTPVNDPPIVPANVVATAGDATVSLAWSASYDVEGSAVTYQIYRRDAAGVYGSQPLNTVSATTYTDKAVVNGNAYYYFVVALDASGAASAGSAEVSATPDIRPVVAYATQNPTLTYGTVSGDYTASFTADGAAQTITEAGTSTGARLQADYSLQSSVIPSSVTALSIVLAAEWSSQDGTADPLLISIWDYTTSAWKSLQFENGRCAVASPQNFISGGIIQVRFADGAVVRREKKDTLRIDALFAEMLCGTQDTTAPTPPSGLVATALQNQVQLTWTPNPETDLAGYRVYRSTASASGYAPVIASLVATSSYTDSGLAAGTYYYLVTAVDKAGNESLGSPEISTTVTAAPQSTFHVQTISPPSLIVSGKSYKASATAIVVNATHEPMGAVTLTAEWWLESGGSSSLLQTQNGATDSNGVATFASAPFKATTGTTVTLHITGATLTGYGFAETESVLSSDPVTVP